MKQKDKWKSRFSLEEKDEKQGSVKNVLKTMTQKTSFDVLCVLSQERKSLRHLERQKMMSVAAVLQMAQKQSDTVIDLRSQTSLVAHSLKKRCYTEQKFHIHNSHILKPSSTVLRQQD